MAPGPYLAGFVLAQVKESGNRFVENQGGLIMMAVCEAAAVLPCCHKPVHIMSYVTTLASQLDLGR